MSCWQCGASLPPDVGFCRACGALVRPRSAPPSTTATPLQQSSVVSTGAPRASGASATWQSPTAAGWSGTVPVAATPQAATRPMGGDVVCMAGSGFVLASLFLSWYNVTLTALGVRFFASLEQAFLARLFPRVAAGLGGLTGPLSSSVSALGEGAGGWRWAILVVSIVVILETLLAISSGAATRSPSPWPHTVVQLVLTIAEFVLVIAAFFNVPYGNVPSAYMTVGHGFGSYLGLFASLIACGGACVAWLGASPSAASL